MREALCACLLSVCLWGADPPAPPPAPTAGQVDGLVPKAFRNASPAQLKEPVIWNDLLRTEEKGRLRVTLHDGSLLSLGSRAQLRVVQHDPQSQQTWLDLAYGELRSRVKRLTQPNSRFTIKTPQAILGVLGTDFYVFAESGRTEVMCFSGAVYVAAPDGRPIMILPAGRMTEIERGRPLPHREISDDRDRRGRERTRLDDKEVEISHVLHAELSKGLDSKKSKPGDAVMARTTRDAQVDEQTKIPKGSVLIGRVVEAQARANKDAASRLAVVFEKAVLRNGQQVALRAAVQAVRAPVSSASFEEAFGRSSGAAMAGSGSGGRGGSSGRSGGGTSDGSGSSGSSGSSSSGSSGSSGGSGSSGSSGGSGSSGTSGDSGSSGSGSSGSSGGSGDSGSGGGGGSGSDDRSGSSGGGSDDRLSEYSTGTYGLASTSLQAANVEGGVVLVSSEKSVKVEGGSQLILRLPE